KMDKAANGADIADVSAFLKNLQLGEAAKRDVGTGANQIPDMNSFSYGDGWLKLPSGHIVQAFGANFDSTGSYINFPIPFLKEVLAIVPGVMISTTAAGVNQFAGISWDNVSLTRFFAKYNIGSSNHSFFIAIGK
ncbi:gp53-like domain-containing protein, partial [Citrobacter sedlakii]|uniref:gp53-like domain-containing protein n=1 Tax=Citrobacter sedlakii TaxID=67826 RepID=UPI003DA15484